LRSKRPGTVEDDRIGITQPGIVAIQVRQGGIEDEFWV
jgi:hypothetical protein